MAAVWVQAPRRWMYRVSPYTVFSPHMDDEALQQKAMAFHRLWQHRLPVFTLVAQMRHDKIVINAS